MQMGAGHATGRADAADRRAGVDERADAVSINRSLAQIEPAAARQGFGC